MSMHFEPLRWDAGARAVVVRNANIDDASNIQALYFQAYQGHYTLELINNLNLMKKALQSHDYLWLVLDYQGQVVGSLVFLVDREQKLGKVFAANVHEDFRGHNFTSRMIAFGLSMLIDQKKAVDIVYATTRTVSPAPQKLVAGVGFKKLGIFPNVRKIEDYETHGLAAYFSADALAKRKKPVLLTPELKPLYDIVREDLNLEDPKIESIAASNTTQDLELLAFEVITGAPNFIRQRFVEQQRSGSIRMHFFPFQDPNLLLVTPDLSFEVYCNYSEQDRHCVIIGYGGTKSIDNYTLFLDSVSRTLEDVGIRYIEILVGAYKPRKIQEVMQARFLPSAYFPALRLVTKETEQDSGNSGFLKAGERLDYIIFSKSFEILDFQKVKPQGRNRDFLRYYFEQWKRLYIDVWGA